MMTETDLIMMAPSNDKNARLLSPINTKSPSSSSNGTVESNSMAPLLLIVLLAVLLGVFNMPVRCEEKMMTTRASPAITRPPPGGGGSCCGAGSASAGPVPSGLPCAA